MAAGGHFGFSDYLHNRLGSSTLICVTVSLYMYEKPKPRRAVDAASKTIISPKFEISGI